MGNNIKIILASSSKYRKELLKRLQINFTTKNAKINEKQINNETASNMVMRLSEEKAKYIAKNNPDSLIIGSDQTVKCMDMILGKPGDRETAKKQLTLMSGKTIIFHTGLCVLNCKTKQSVTESIKYKVKFRKLTENNIDNYLNKEKPFDCAGSFKSEKLGITLVESMEGDDPTALIGLPLIKLCQMLREQGIGLP